MIAHVTSPFTDKIAPRRSNPPTDPRTFLLSPSSLFLLPSVQSPFLLPFSSSFSRFERLVSAREHVAIAQPPGNSITVDHLDHELTPCRARSRFTSASISLAYIYVHMCMYIYTHGQDTALCLSLSFSGETNDRSFLR